MDILMFSKNDEYYDDGVNYTFCDNMPLSPNKIRLAAASAPVGERFGLLCRFYKYHSRWNDLSRDDFTYKSSEMRDISKGYCMLNTACDNAVHTDTSGETQTLPLSEKNTKYLYKIIDLCRENDVELILVKTPSNSTSEEKKYYNSVKEIADKNGITFADYNLRYEEIGLNTDSDFFDATHLNMLGAKKFTEYFTDTVGYFGGKICTDDDWTADYETYSSALAEMR